MTSPIGQRIKDLRDAKHWTQGELAYQAKVGRSWLSNLEAGLIANPRAIDITRVAERLGTDVHYLLTGQHSTSGVGMIVPADKAPLIRRIIEWPTEHVQRAIEMWHIATTGSQPAQEAKHEANDDRGDDQARDESSGTG